MKTLNFDKDWRFCFENKMDGYNYFGLWKIEGGARACERFLDFNNWEKINLPHDWAIAMPIDKTANNLAGGRLNCRYNAQMSELLNESNNIYNVGWYRKHFEFNPKWRDKRIFIEFEGVYRDAILWVNGTYIMRHTSGYTGFVWRLRIIYMPAKTVYRLGLIPIKLRGGGMMVRASIVTFSYTCAPPRILR